MCTGKTYKIENPCSDFSTSALHHDEYNFFYQYRYSTTLFILSQHVGRSCLKNFVVDNFRWTFIGWVRMDITWFLPNWFFWKITILYYCTNYFPTSFHDGEVRTLEDSLMIRSSFSFAGRFCSATQRKMTVRSSWSNSLFFLVHDIAKWGIVDFYLMY